MLKGMALAAIAGGLSSGVGTKTANDRPYGYPRIRLPTGDAIPVSDSESVDETAYAKILGCSHDGVYAFEAVLYGADTSGTNRFMASQKPAPWPGVRAVFITELCAHRRDLQDGRTMKNFGCSPGTTAPLAKTA